MIFHDLAEKEELGSLGFKLPPQFEAQLKAYREIYLNYQPPDSRYLSNHRGHLMFLRPEEQSLMTPDLLRALTFTGTEAELIDNVRAVKTAGFSQFAVLLRAGHEFAMLEDWHRVLWKV